MRRLLLTLATCVAVLAMVDQWVVRWASSVQSAFSQREEAIGNLAAHRLTQIRRDQRRRVAEVLHQWESLPSDKPPRELRIALIGNSSALFALQVDQIQDRLQESHPDRDVVVLPLIIEGMRVAEERTLVEAALAKSPDLVVLTPNPKSLVHGSSGALDGWFDASHPDQPVEQVLAAARAFLRRHWLLYRERFALREWLLTGPTTEEVQGMARALADISSSAETSGYAGVLAAYRRHDLQALVVGVRTKMQRQKKSRRILRVVENVAKRVEASGARGVAIYMPLNPLFRIPAGKGRGPELPVENAHVKILGFRVLSKFAGHGFATYDALDALPGSSFIDLIHVNEEGSRAFSALVADYLIQALEMDPAAPASGRSSPL